MYYKKQKAENREKKEEEEEEEEEEESLDRQTDKRPQPPRTSRSPRHRVFFSISTTTRRYQKLHTLLRYPNSPTNHV